MSQENKEKACGCACNCGTPIIDTIPSAESMAEAIHERVYLRNQKLAEELAARCVAEYFELFEANPERYVLLKTEKCRNYKLFDMAKAILENKGWSLSHGVGDGIMISPKIESTKPVPVDHAAIARIPTGDTMASKIYELVEVPRQRLAERFTAWCITEFIRKFEAEPADHIIVEPDYEVPYQIYQTVEDMLRAKGWYFSHWQENSFYIAPSTKAKQGH